MVDVRRAVLCVAGEASGDALLAPVVASLRAAGVRCFGTGGDASAAAGLELVAHVRRFTAHGLVEALPALPAAVRVYRALCECLPTADAVLLVDAPELNLRLLRRARAAGRPTVWLAPPQIWAWRPGRAPMVGLADALLCPLPFEVPAYRALGLEATFVGHPLAETTMAAPEPVSGRGLAILPGSRPGTVGRLLAPMLEAAGRLYAEGLVDRVHLGWASTLPPPFGAQRRDGGPCPIDVHSGAAAALAASQVALAAFGTVTLEAALAARPLVTAGRLHPVTAAIASRLVRAPHLALPNLVLAARRVPEFWQSAATPAALADALRPGFGPGGEARRAAAVALAGELRTALSVPGPAFGLRVAERILDRLAPTGSRGHHAPPL